MSENTQRKMNNSTYSKIEDIFLKTIEPHLQWLNNKVNSKEQILVIYQSFPLRFVSAIEDKYQSINFHELTRTGSRLDLHKIKQNKTEISKNFLSEWEGIKVGTYEEFIIIVENVNLSLFKGKIILVKNDFFDNIPNESSIQFSDIEDESEKNSPHFKNDDILKEFYADSKVYFGLNYIVDKAISEDQMDFVEAHLFSDGIDYKLKDDTLGDNPKECKFSVDADGEAESYFKLLYDIYTGNQIESEICIQTSRDTLPKRISEIEKIAKLLSLSSTKLYLTKKEISPVISYRDDFSQVLKKYWSSDNFRELIFYKKPDIGAEIYKTNQGIIIEDIVKQVENVQADKIFSDIFITAPTGAGKSVLFQIPAVYIAKKYKLVTIVVSPLIALMRDQVSSLKRMGVKDAEFINSELSLSEKEDIIKRTIAGDISILYLSPETLLSTDITNFIGDRKLGLLVIDEAHLVTTWGRDFRIDYWFLGNYVRKNRKLLGYKFPVLSLTATAVYSGDDDVVFETAESLNMQNTHYYIGNVRRDEISFKISKFEYEGNHDIKKIEHSIEVISENANKGIKTIAYFPWTNQINEVYDSLSEEIKEKVKKYFSSVDKIEKQISAEKFQSGDATVMLATKAFGMGIDISDIKEIYHHAPSGSLADYVQEVGRVARDKKLTGTARVDFTPKDLKYSKILYGLSAIRQYQVKFAIQKLLDLYRMNGNKQNFLTTADDFAYIFSEKNHDLDTKAKSVLMLIEKDLLLKYGYNVVLVRPRSIFSTVFICVDKKIENKFIDKYGDFVCKVSTIEQNQTFSSIGNQWHSGATSMDLGDIYEIRLNEIWESYHRDKSFPVVKKMFFDGTLFPEFKETIPPRYRLQIILKQSPVITLSYIEEYFEKIELTLNKLSGKFFSQQELERELREHMGDEGLSRRISNLLVNIYTSRTVNAAGYSVDKGTFLQVRRDQSGRENYHVNNTAFEKVKHFALSQFKIIFQTEELTSTKYLGYSNPSHDARTQMAFLLESFKLGNYEIVGGTSPQIFIRINDPYRIQQLSRDNKYINKILDDIEKRQKRSFDTMQYFFGNAMNDRERWDFIESYFLGKLSLPSETYSE